MARDCPNANSGGGVGDRTCHKVNKSYYYLMSNIVFKSLLVPTAWTHGKGLPNGRWRWRSYMS